MAIRFMITPPEESGGDEFVPLNPSEIIGTGVQRNKVAYGLRR
jgi:hypothetical protein